MESAERADFVEVTEVGEPYPDENDRNATAMEDLTPQVDFRTGKKLPIFKVLDSCVLADTCVRTDGFFKLDPDGDFNADNDPRAIVVRQPRSEAEVEVFREHCIACNVSCIIEVPPEEQ